MADQVADSEAIRRFIASFYAALSFREGGQPNWDMLRGLFWPGAAVVELRGGETATMTPPEFIARLRSQIAHGEMRGLQEREVESSVKVQGDVAQVFSQCEVRTVTQPPRRGINAFQLLRLQGRWVCQSILRAEGPPAPPQRRVMPATAPRGPGPRR